MRKNFDENVLQIKLMKLQQRKLLQKRIQSDYTALSVTSEYFIRHL